MLLQRLVDYSARIPLPPSLYMYGCPEWILALSEEGKPQGMSRPAKQAPQIEREPVDCVPYLGNLRTQKERPLLFCDNGGYVLGLTAKGKKNHRVETQHAAFRNLVQACSEKVNRPEVHAVRLFYERWFNHLFIPEDYKPEQTVAFRVGDRLLIELPEVQTFWREYALTNCEIVGKEAPCMVCNRTGKIVRRHFVSLKGIPGGQTSGMALVSANEDAFCSYGFEKDFNIPLCLDCSERALKTLYYLIHTDRHHITLGEGGERGIVYCFWTRAQDGLNTARQLGAPDLDDVKYLLNSVEQSRPLLRFEGRDFYAVALSANKARVVVRNYLELTIPEVQHNLAQWFRWQQLHNQDGKDEPHGVYRLATSLFPVSKGREQIVKTGVPETMIRCALTGTPLPADLLLLAVQRNAAEMLQHKNPQEHTKYLQRWYARCRVIKAVLASQNPDYKEALTMLNRDLNDPAYKCGRLLAVIERIQGVAIDTPNATLTDKYYGSASTAPASVFGVLLRMTQPHLSKIRKKSEGLAIWLERELHNAMPDYFPTTLSLKGQGLFALGYYHQRAELRKRKPADPDAELDSEEVPPNEDA